jgi:hypothetical protein
MFLSDNGWQIVAGEACEDELRLEQAKRAEAKRFSGPLTAKLSEVAGAVSAVFGLEPIGKVIKTCGVAEKDLDGYAQKVPDADEETKIPFYDVQSRLDRAADDALYELIRAEKFKEFARLEAKEEWESSKQTTATPAPAAGPAIAVPSWSPITSLQRASGYRWPLYQFLKAAHAAGKPIPKARDVLDKWRENPPPDVATVTDNGLKYYDAKGNTKPADLEAIRKAIDRMIQ